MAQRASLERAASMVTQLPGPALMIGWHDGTAYDHLREAMRRRDILVFDKAIDAAEDLPPTPENRIVGDPFETLPQAWERFPREAAFAHLNFPAPRGHVAAELAPLVAPLLRPGAIVIVESALDLPGWDLVTTAETPRDVRDYLYRIGG